MAKLFPNIAPGLNAPNAPKKNNCKPNFYGELDSVKKCLFQEEDNRYKTPPRQRRNMNPPSVKKERRDAAARRNQFNSPERTTDRGGIPHAPKKNPRATTPLRYRTNGIPGVRPPAPKKNKK